MCHKPAPIAIVGVIVGVASKVVLWTDDRGPQIGLDKGEG